MSNRKSRPHNATPEPSRAQRRRASPLVQPVWDRDWVIAGLAVAGALLALVLWWTGDSGALPGCSAEGGCASVQQSPWARLFGIPVAVWGAGTYLGLAALAILGHGTVRLLLPLLATLGLAISIQLNAVTWHELHAVCVWCVASLAIMAAICARAWLQVSRPARPWLAGVALVVALTGTLGLHQVHSGNPSATANPAYLAALAKHLKEGGALFYGAHWCGACAGQKALFGDAAEALPYIECSPHGPGTPPATDCLAAEIRSYPTWVIRGDKRQGALGLAQLARLSGFAPPPDATKGD